MNLICKTSVKIFVNFYCIMLIIIKVVFNNIKYFCKNIVKIKLLIGNLISLSMLIQK